ncbi:DUF6309 family protein [Nannocystis pusilla]|uniref:DUF6309 family protein n=1 Tax=Nannocystis pusilla TaxID=889268 RepID=UPI003B824F67
MRVVEVVQFAEVLARFRREHATGPVHEANTNALAERALGVADAMLGVWHRVRLGPAALGRVLLPWHESEGGRCKLVPRTGLTVAAAAARLREAHDDYPDHSPVCWRKLQRHRAADPASTAIYLSTRPIDHVDYAALTPGDGLVHLDGLHRMVAWAAYGLLQGGREVEAYVAGPLRSQ